MIGSQHFSESELLEMINGIGDSEKTRLIGNHVHRCAKCRNVLDALAAQSAIWDKAPILLRGTPAAVELGATQATNSFDSEGLSSEPEDGREPTWHYPLDALLDRPMHPEMLGRIGKYDIEREVGRGGMGVVLKAHDAELNRPVAIKILAPHLASHATARKRFAQEAIAAAGVLHPNVIAVHGVSNEGKTPYIVMPFIDGPSLQSLVERHGPLTEIEIVRIALQIASGLAAAHSQGLVHRDIKPANILVEAGVNRVMITDFGLARAEDDASLTRTGWLMGTPNYMSPEQTRGERADQRSDLFSLGSLIYFLATGRLPFRAETPLGVLHRIQNDEPTPVRQVNHLISKTMSEVIGMLLQKAPQNRFQNAADLHDLLEKHLVYLHQPDISKPPKVIPSCSRDRHRIHPKLVAVAGATIALFVLGYSGYIKAPFQGSEQPPSPIKQPLGDGEVSTASWVAPLGMIDPEARIAESSSPFTTDDSDINDLFSDAVCLFNKRNYEAALEKFRETTKIECYRAHSLYNIGCIYADQGKKEEAFDALNQAIDAGFIDYDHYRCDEDLSTLREEERFEKLLVRIQTLKKGANLLSRAKQEAMCERYDKAETLCRQVLEIDPKNDDAATNLGYVLHQQGKLKEALPWHERAASSESFQGLGNFNLCCFYSLQGEPDKAFEYLDKAIQSGLAECLASAAVRNDTDLASIRNDPRFTQAIQQLSSQECRFRLRCVDPALLQEYQAEGLEPEKHVAFLQNRVSPKLLIRYQEAGLEIDRYQNAICEGREPSDVIKLEQRMSKKGSFE